MDKGFTYSDVLIKPKKTPLSSRREADLTSKFSRNIELNIPLVSSNMETVTEEDMAITMAKHGGLGIVHQFCSPEEQARIVKRVKRETGYVVTNPVTITPDSSVGEAKKILEETNRESIVVEDEEIKGLLTRNDYVLADDDRIVEDVMTEDIVTVDPSIEMDEARQILQENTLNTLIVEDNGLHGIITTEDIRKAKEWDRSVRDASGRLRVAAAVGVGDAHERAPLLVEEGVDALVLDLAHCHSEYGIRRLKEMKERYDVDIVAGNIATAEAAEELVEAGADGLKVGVGPGKVCSTRLMTGAGVPQLTAVDDVSKVAEDHGIPVIADGGLEHPGDIVKAVGAGASCICSGSFFAGTDEAPGPIVKKDGKRFKKYRGSASYNSNKKRHEKQGERTEDLDVFVEGVSVLVDYKGTVEDVIDSLCKGVKSGVSYCGKERLMDVRGDVEFIKITNQGRIESGTRGNKVRD